MDVDEALRLVRTHWWVPVPHPGADGRIDMSNVSDDTELLGDIEFDRWEDATEEDEEASSG